MASHTPQNRIDGREVEGEAGIKYCEVGNNDCRAGNDGCKVRNQLFYDHGQEWDDGKGGGKKIRGECMTTVMSLLSTIIQNIMI